MRYPLRPTTDLCGEWSFTPLRLAQGDSEPSNGADRADFSDAAHPLEPIELVPAAPATPLRVPAAWNADRAGPLAQYQFGRYERRVRLPDWREGSRCVVRFEGVAFACVVRIDGKRAGVHWGPFNEFGLDITRLVRPRANVLLQVTCAWEGLALQRRRAAATEEDASGAPEPLLLHPRGKTRDLRGIWQPVTLEVRPASFISDLSFETRLPGPRVVLKARVAGEPERLQATLKLLDGSRRIAAAHGSPDAHGAIRLSASCAGAQLWSPNHPRLYRAVVALTRGGRQVDRAEFNVGLREVRTEGTELLLNGAPIRLYGTSLTDPLMTQEQVRRRFRWFRALNLGTVRHHGQPHPEHYLNAADELGLLIIDESDLFGTLDAAQYPYSHTDFRRAVADSFREWIGRDRLHPCVIAWSLENEVSAAWQGNDRSALEEFLTWLSVPARRLDGTRPLE